MKGRGYFVPLDVDLRSNLERLYSLQCNTGFAGCCCKIQVYSYTTYSTNLTKRYEQLGGHVQQVYSSLTCRDNPHYYSVNISIYQGRHPEHMVPGTSIGHSDQQWHSFAGSVAKISKNVFSDTKHWHIHFNSLLQKCKNHLQNIIR